MSDSSVIVTGAHQWRLSCGMVDRNSLKVVLNHKTTASPLGVMPLLLLIISSRRAYVGERDAFVFILSPLVWVVRSIREGPIVKFNHAIILFMGMSVGDTSRVPRWRQHPVFL